MLDVLSIPEIRMNERIHVAKLKLESAPDSPSPRGLADLVDNTKTVFHTALVIIRHVTDEQAFEIEFMTHV